MHSVLTRIAGEGPVRFDRFQSDALYGADGFYLGGGAAGRGGEFLTAVETSPEFGRCVANELDALWSGSGRPDPFIVVEGGAGVGTLCASVFGAEPECVQALRWVMVERSAMQRQAAISRLVEEVFADENDLPVAVAADIAGMELEEAPHVIIANELLDNLPVRVVRMVPSRGDARDGEVIWEELFVGVRDSTACEVWRPLDESSTRRAAHHATGLAAGACFPLADHAVQWVARSLKLLRRGGSMILFDYGASTAKLAARGREGWLRTYTGHVHGTDVLSDVGRQDITSDVAFDQLPANPKLESQADWLIHRGIARRRDQLLGDSPKVSPIDAAGLLQRGEIAGIDALLDLDGMGSFVVATWTG